MDGFPLAENETLEEEYVQRTGKGGRRLEKNQRLWPDPETLEFKVSRYWIFLGDGQVQG